MPGLMVMVYRRTSGSKQTDFEFTEVCLDPAEPVLDASEPISGLTLVQDFGDGILQYQIVTPGSQDHQRTSLSIGPMMSLIDGDDVLLEDAAAVGLQAQYFGSPAIQHPDADNHFGQGYAYSALQEDAAFPDGNWLLHFTVQLRSRISGPQLLDHTHLGIHAVVELGLDGTAQTSAEFIEETFLMSAPVSDGGLDLEIEDGRIGGNLTFSFENTRLPAGRTENEWATAKVVVPFIRGHVTKGDSDVQMHALGIGQMITSDGTGRQDVDQVFISMMGTRLPEGVGAAEHMEGY